MEINQKITNIRTRLGMDEKKFSHLIGIPYTKIKEWESGETKPSEEDTISISKIFSIDARILKDPTKDISNLTARKPIDKSKYSNSLSMYGEILKEYFKAPWKIYVLAKSRQKGTLEGFFDLFLNNSKEAIMKEMNEFAPCYLAQKGDIKLLVSITDTYLEISEINIDTDEKRFVFNKYRYTKANEIKLK